jgi:hypothetical protein
MACGTAAHGVGPLPTPSAEVITSLLNDATHAPSPLPYLPCADSHGVSVPPVGGGGNPVSAFRRASFWDF